MTLGQNGLFMKAQVAKKEYEQSEVQEDLSMLITQYTWDKASEKTDKSLGDYLKENGETSVNENSDGKTLEVKYKGYVFTVNKDSGEITDCNKGDDNDNPVTPTIKPKVGDVVDYKPDTSSDYELSAEKSGLSGSNQIIDSKFDPAVWKVMELDKNGNVIKLFGVPNTNMEQIEFSGAKGYNNGVYLLNDICAKRYKNDSLGAKARSLNIEDIESRMNESGIEARNANKGNSNVGIQYGTTKTYTGSNVKYPAIYTQEKYSGVGVSDVVDGTQVIAGNIDAIAQSKMNPLGKNGSDSIYTTLPETSETTGPLQENLTCTQTYYSVSQLSSYYDDLNFYNMIFGTGAYFWIASRYVNSYSNNSGVCFGIHTVSGSSIGGADLFGTRERSWDCLAPVVSFSSGIQAKSGNGTETDPYVIGK